MMSTLFVLISCLMYINPISPMCCECQTESNQPGCTQDVECQENICGVDTFCCNTGWDSLCVSRATTVCTSTPYPTPYPTISPITASPTAPTTSMTNPPTMCCACTSKRRGEKSCSVDALCTANICSVDPYCCNTRWDTTCGDLASDVCYGTAYPTPPLPSSPTISTTQQPSINPSAQPTKFPSEIPTNYPTLEPTMNPTIPPSAATSDPTQTPTKSPTVPTLEPTYTPSVFPTSDPTLNPTANPTDLPSSSPSDMPTNNPTTDPSQSPSDTPSTTPSLFPSISPTQVTDNPTANPTTDTPTSLPTSQPSIIPTNHPSMVPTHNPTGYPSTSLPTTQPSIIPTEQPSIQPTLNPTKYPLSNPTENPTSKPSKAPVSGILVIPGNEIPSDSTTNTETPESNGNQEGEHEDSNTDSHESEGQESRTNDGSSASAMFGPYTDAILLTLSTICIMCTILILVVFCLKRRKDEEKATADIKNIEMMHMEQQTESTKDSKENESGSLEKVVEGNGDILTTDRLNIDADIRNRGGTFDSMPSHTTISNNSPQMMHQQSLPNYSNNVSMQPSFPASFSAAQNYLNISYPNGNSNYRHGSYANEYSNYSHQNQPSPLPAISVMSNTEHNLILPTNASMMNGSYSSSIMNNGDPVLLRNLSSNISAFSQMVPISHNPSMISSYSMHQSQVQQSSFPQQSPLPLNAGISLPVMKQRRKSSDANSEMGDNATPGLNIHNNDDTEEKVFEDGLHIVYDHNQESQEEDEHNSDAMSENSDATSEEGIDIIYDDEPGTPDDDAFKQMNDCDLMSPGAGRNHKDEYTSPGRVNKNKHVKFNIHSNNDSIYNEDDAQSVVGGVTDIGNQ